MTTYYLLIPNTDAEWAAKGADGQQATYDAHERFQKRLAERGHEIVGGAALAPKHSARTVRADGVTDGPYTETAEHIAGVYVVQTTAGEDLIECCRLLAEVESAIEVREAV